MLKKLSRLEALQLCSVLQCGKNNFEANIHIKPDFLLKMQLCLLFLFCVFLNIYLSSLAQERFTDEKSN